METKQCQNCKKDFTIESDDFSFYEKIKVPAPTFCPECRMQRRLAWRNEHNLHFRECNNTGHKIISIYSSDNKFPVYDRDYWWSDKWDQHDFGIDLDFSKPFLEQWREMSHIAPRPNLLQTNVINGEYSNYLLDSKNLYMDFSGIDQENTMYCIGSVVKTRDSLDIHLSTNIENSYWLIECLNCSNVKFSKFCNDCIDSMFLIDCRNCQNCVSCVGLRNEKYCIFNKKYTKEDYLKIINEYGLGSYINLDNLNKKFKEFSLSVPYKYARIYKALDCTGDDIQNAKNCKICFYTRDNAENMKYSYRNISNVKDGYDITLAWGNVELIYECLSINKGQRNLFSSMCWGAQNVQYSDNCFNCKNIFGCVALKNAEYCILNKQYTKEEYVKLVPKIIEHMNNLPFIDRKGRIYKYGEFFPVEFSALPYNESLAQQYYPLSEKEILDQGFNYLDQENRNYNITMKNEDIPDNIKNVEDNIVQEVIECAHKGECNDNCQKAFKIIPDELSFYRKHNLPIPRMCLNCRHQARVKERNPLKLWHRSCMKEGCDNEFETSYSPERREIVYCERCYQNEVY